jgi:transketolase
MGLIGMRDAFIKALYEKMFENNNIFFISADLGAPALDGLREQFPERYINVGIAEQNLINISTGLALEGFTVYAYAIASFLSMRALEQIRNNLSIMSQVKDMNINLISMGAGLSYDVTGPTHHCLEDSCIINVLPNLSLLSPCDAILSERIVEYTLDNSGPKYIRMDGKPQPVIYSSGKNISFKKGISELRKGSEVCIISTGYMTHLALKLADKLSQDNIETCVLDVFMLKPFNEKLTLHHIKPFNEKLTLHHINRCKHVVTMEEAFLNKGGLDSIIENICYSNKVYKGLTKIGFKNRYIFDVGNREYLYKVNGLDLDSMINKVKLDLNKEH